MNMMAMTDEQILSVTEDRYMNVEEIETELIDLSKKKIF
jgi:hypothetical protein